MRQHLGAQATEQDIVRRAIFGMQLQTVAFEHLSLDVAARDLLADLGADWVAEYRQPTLLGPEAADPPIDASGDRWGRLGEAARRGLRWSDGEQRQ